MNEIYSKDLHPGATFDGPGKRRWRLIRPAGKFDHPDAPKEKLLNRLGNKWIAGPVKRPAEQYLCCFDVILRLKDLRWKNQ